MKSCKSCLFIHRASPLSEPPGRSRYIDNWDNVLELKSTKSHISDEDNVPSLGSETLMKTAPFNKNKTINKQPQS